MIGLSVHEAGQQLLHKFLSEFHLNFMLEYLDCSNNFIWTSVSFSHSPFREILVKCDRMEFVRKFVQQLLP